MKNSEKTRISMGLSQILRHSARSMGLSIDSSGYVPVSEILGVSSFAKHNLTLEDLKTIVEEDKKSRYTLTSRMEGDQETWLIKANQGHSFPVENLELRKITDPEEFPEVIHGTYLENMTGIMEKGLLRMTREYIHLANGLNAASGIRKNCTVIIHIDMKKAIQDGIEFFISPNNVILTKGIRDEGILPTTYFTKILEDPNKNK